MYAEAIEKNLALRLAFEKACVDLGISAADTNRRENLALMMLKIGLGSSPGSRYSFENEPLKTPPLSVKVTSAPTLPVSGSICFQTPATV